MLTFAQEKTHYHHLFRGENVTSSTEFYLRRGASPTNNSIWMKESTLECSPLNRSLHTWCKVLGSTRVRTALLFQQRQDGSLKALKHNCARIDNLPHTSLPISAAHFTALAELAPAVIQSHLHSQLPRHIHHPHAVQRVGTWSDWLTFKLHRELRAKMWGRDRIFRHI